MQAQRALHRDFPVAEGGVGEDLGLGCFLEVQEGATDALDVFGCQLAVLLAEVLAQGLEPLTGIDELHLAPAVRSLSVGQHPDVGRDTGVVEEVERERDDGFQPVVLDEPAADVTLPLAGVAGEERRAVVNLCDAAAEGGLGVHLRRHVDEEEHLTVAGARDEREFLTLVHHLEARISHSVLAAHRLEVFLPALPVWRVGEHEVELPGRESVVRERGQFRAADDMVGALAFAFEQHVRLADGVGLGIDLLAILNKFLDPDIDLSRAGIDNHSMGTVFEELVRKFNEENNEEAGEHWTPRDAVRLMANLVFAPIEADIKSGHYLLYDCACGTGGMLTVGEETLRAIGAKRGQQVECLLYQRADRIGFGQRLELISELEVIEDVLNVGREAVEVILEIGEQLLLAPAGLQIAQGELRRIVEGLTRRIAERGPLLSKAGPVEHLLSLEHRLLGGLQHRIHAPDDAHRQDHIRVLASLEEVAQDIVGDSPDEGDYFVVRCLVHFLSYSTNQSTAAIPVR